MFSASDPRSVFLSLQQPRLMTGQRSQFDCVNSGFEWVLVMYVNFPELAGQTEPRLGNWAFCCHST